MTENRATAFGHLRAAGRPAAPAPAGDGTPEIPGQELHRASSNPAL
ncbi:MAG: hypothetical protein J0I11_04635 [Actinobacteria bacterium]|nr:hypothetical protein [Actinomycetota bacterium]